LTTSEAQVAVALAEGRDIDEIAEMRRISPGTLRAQLRSIFAKRACAARPLIRFDKRLDKTPNHFLPEAASAAIHILTILSGSLTAPLSSRAPFLKRQKKARATTNDKACPYYSSRHFLPMNSPIPLTS
jgi:hypothetical protein